MSRPLDISFNDKTQWVSTWKPDVLYVVIHGWTSDYLESPVSSLRGALLLQDQHLESCLISVDWAQGALASYRQSAANTLPIGMEIGYLLFKLVSSGRIASDKIHIIGLDMGAHIGTIAATHFTKMALRYSRDLASTNIGTLIGRRTSLAPLGLHFDSLQYVDNALFIDVIHTSTPRFSRSSTTTNFLRREFGPDHLTVYPAKIGVQRDYYPNEGASNRDCSPALRYGCSFNLAIAFFKASLRNGYDRNLFKAYPFATNYIEGPKRKRIWPSYLVPELMGIDADRKSRQRGGDFTLYLTLDEVRRPPNPTLNRVQRGDCTQGPPESTVVYPDDHPGCGMRLEPEKRIFNGLKANPQQFPWLVCIMNPTVGYFPFDYDRQGIFKGMTNIFRQRDEIDDPKTRKLIKGYEQSCTGSLLHDDLVVTAAHCFLSVFKNLT